MSKPETRNAAPAISIVPILSINFVGTLGFSIVLPFLVFLVTRWGGNALIYGIMGATYSFFQLIGAPILGRWSDTYGRRKILLLSQLGTLLSWIVFVTALLTVFWMARIWRSGPACAEGGLRWEKSVKTATTATNLLIELIFTPNPCPIKVDAAAYILVWSGSKGKRNP